MVRSHHARAHSGKQSYPFPVWNGIFEHRARIGDAVWVFLWCIDKITREDGGVGYVFGGSEIKASRIADELPGLPDRTVRSHLSRLAQNGFITRKRTPHGFVITVLNSRKFNIWRSEKGKKAMAENSTSPSGVMAKNSTMMAASCQLTAESSTSHKEKVYDTAVDPTETQQAPSRKTAGTAPAENDGPRYPFLHQPVMTDKEWAWGRENLAKEKERIAAARARA
jgi:hypothetical protein